MKILVVDDDKEIVDAIDIYLRNEGINVIKAYDVWKEKNLYGKVTMGIVRTTFIIDEDGIIIKIFQKANANTNAKEALEYLQSIR